MWVLLAGNLYQLNFNLLQATFFFSFSTLATRYVGRFFVGKGLVEKKSENDLILFLRAVVGGMIISAVTVFASRLGANLSGTLLAFPIAYILISFNIHQVFGKSIVTGVVYSALLGTISLAVFCVAFAILLQMVPLIRLSYKLIWISFCNCINVNLGYKSQKPALILNLPTAA